MFAAGGSGKDLKICALLSLPDVLRTGTVRAPARLPIARIPELSGARLWAKRQPQRIQNAAAGLRHSRAPDKSGHYRWWMGTFHFFLVCGTARV